MDSARTMISHQKQLIKSNQLGYHKGNYNIRLSEAKANKSEVNLSNILFMMQQVNQGHFLF